VASFNNVVVMGNLTRDPELRYLPSGAAVCDVGLAVNEKYKAKSGEMVEEVSFIDVTCWSRTAELVSEYLRKGSSVLFQGKLKQERWKDNEGKDRSKLKVIAERMTMLGGKSGGGGGGDEGGGESRQSAPSGGGQRRGSAPQSEPVYSEPGEDDIPF
jgi:single-strand DNA-binding protein